jgi:predicted N-formylglutamate amidohydrolase
MGIEDEPAPVELVNARGAAPIVLICEHAANHIPARHAGLGLRPEDRDRHIAWDIGAAAVTRELAAALDAPAFLGTYSRLLIDLNRPTGVPSSIPERSEATDIPGNIGLPSAERDARRDVIFAPFHARVAGHLDRRRPKWIVAIHSFTPVYLGVARPWSAGVLYGEARVFGEDVIAALRVDETMLIGANVPYSIARDEDYSIPVHGDDRGIPAILLEIRNDLIREPRGVTEWAGRLAIALRQSCATAPPM